MKKFVICSILACALLVCALLAQAVSPPTEPPTETPVPNEITPFSLTRNSGCNDSSGISSAFDVSDATTTRFYIENRADFDITIKLQKEKDHKWNDSNMNGETSVTVKANAHKLIESNGATYENGTYRFSATGSIGDNYDYLVTMREFDN